MWLRRGLHPCFAHFRSLAPFGRPRSLARPGPASPERVLCLRRPSPKTPNRRFRARVARTPHPLHPFFAHFCSLAPFDRPQSLACLVPLPERVLRLRQSSLQSAGRASPHPHPHPHVAATSRLLPSVKPIKNIAFFHHVCGPALHSECGECNGPFAFQLPGDIYALTPHKQVQNKRSQCLPMFTEIAWRMLTFGPASYVLALTIE